MSIVSVNDMLDDNKSFRIDSEYFKKEFIEFTTVFKNNLLSKIADFAKVADGDHSKFPENQLQEVRYLQAKDIKNYFIENNKPVFISKDYFNKNKRSHIIEKNILLSIMGNVGDVAITPKGFKPSLANRAIAILKDIENIDPYYLFVFLCSKFAQIQIERKKNGGVQERLNLEILSDLKVPILSPSYQKYIQDIVLSFQNKREQSDLCYQKAEQFLLEELGLKDWQPSAEQTNIKSFKESFLSTGRLDAEYYQPKYEDYLSLVLNYRNGYKIIEWACKIKDFNYQPNDIQEYKYIELSNIGNTGEINGCSNNLGINLPSRARRQVKKGDVLISSIEGSLSSCALVTDEYNDAICSTGFYVINSKYINSETLLVLFKSEVLQNLLKQGCSGTILTAINKNEFLNIPIPIIEDTVQNNISSLIKHSFILRKQSEHLLEVAKHAVEIAIEQNEEEAIKYINENSKYE